MSWFSSIPIHLKMPQPMSILQHQLQWQRSPPQSSHHPLKTLQLFNSKSHKILLRKNSFLLLPFHHRHHHLPHHLPTLKSNLHHKFSQPLQNVSTHQLFHLTFLMGPNGPLLVVLTEPVPSFRNNVFVNRAGKASYVQLRLSRVISALPIISNHVRSKRTNVCVNRNGVG